MLKDCIILDGKKDQYYKRGSINYMSLRGVKIRYLNSDNEQMMISDSDDEALKITDFGITLEYLCLNPGHLASSTIISIIESCRGLEELKIHYNYGENSTNAIVFKIDECSHKLLNLDFGGYFLILLRMLG